MLEGGDRFLEGVSSSVGLQPPPSPYSRSNFVGGGKIILRPDRLPPEPSLPVTVNSILNEKKKKKKDYKKGKDNISVSRARNVQYASCVSVKCNCNKWCGPVATKKKQRKLEKKKRISFLRKQCCAPSVSLYPLTFGFQ